MRKTIVDLEAELKDAGRRIEELRGERDKAQELVERMREHINDANRMIESWIEAFEMKLADDGIYKWKASFVEGDEWYEKYSALLKKWNAAVADFNARIAPRPVGRPLAASDTQVASVLKLRKQGLSLRSIADQTSLSSNTVCTIIGNENRTTRAWRKRYERIQPDKFANASWQSRSRTRDALPKRVNEMIETGNALVTEAKGLGRGR